MGFSVSNNSNSHYSNTYSKSIYSNSNNIGSRGEISKLPTSKSYQSISTPKSTSKSSQSSAPTTASSLVKLGESILRYVSDTLQGKDSTTPPKLAEVKKTLSALVESSGMEQSAKPEIKEGINTLIEAFTPSNDVKKSSDEIIADIKDGVFTAFNKIGLSPDAANVAVQAILKWDKLSDTERFNASSGIAINVLQNLDIIDRNEARNLSLLASTISAIAQPGLSNRDRALAIVDTLKEIGTVSFSGNANAPESIEGIPVVGSTVFEDGTPGFMLADGSVVSEADVTTSSNVQSALSAIQLLTSDASTEDKVKGLLSVGLNAASANDLINNVTAGKIGAVLSVVDIATDWKDMNSLQKVAASSQTASSVLSALGASSGAQLLPGVSVVTSLITGFSQAKDVVNALGDLSRKEGVKVGAIGLGSAGSIIGAGVATASAVLAGAELGATLGSAVPLIGTAIGGLIGAGVGALVGAFGSSKSPGQMMRDKWRDSLEAQGFAHKIDKSHHITLADGTEYNIGADGGGKLPNVDGTERHTYDVDWSNPIAGESIPMAHLFVMATGLDPSITKNDLWTTTVGQSLNAATSNAASIEDVTNNFRAMLSAGQIAPEALAIRVEVLRLTNKITDQEYTVYLHTMNKVFGTELKPNDREVAHKAIVEQLASQPEISEGDQFLLQSLTDESVYAESVKALEERVGRDSSNIEAQ